jgi:hypothetical protein
VRFADKPPAMMVVVPLTLANMTLGTSFGSRLERTWGNPSWWNLVAVLPWALFVIFGLYGLREDQMTAARQKTTCGQIVSHDPPNHNRFGYQFGVNGKMYAGWAIPATRDYQIGQQVLVYYDPLDPNKSQLADFAENGPRILGPVSFCLFGICGVALYILLRRRAIRSSRVAQRPTGAN